MQDPRSGPAGVTSIVMVLLLKFVCLQQVVMAAPVLLLLAPSLARGLMPILFLHTPYVRDAGLATPFKEGLVESTCYLQAALLGLLWPFCWDYRRCPPCCWWGLYSGGYAI